jgi:conjugal transfer mating pair stabilization protein TraN
VIITNADTNELLSKLLRYYGVANAWIGAEDKNRSGNFNSVYLSRFRWRDNSEITYSNWAAGQPDNKFSGADIGDISIYGEHWAAMRTDGYWHDTGINSSFHSLVQFDGKLACVSGKDAIDSNSSLAQEVCNNGTTCVACVDLNADFENFDTSIFKKCLEGGVFDPAIGTGSTSKKQSVCPVTSQQCNISEECPTAPVKVDINRTIMQCTYTKPETDCAAGYADVNGVCTARLKRDAHCPSGNHACVQTNPSEDKYYCSLTECADIADSNSFIDDDDEYTGDQSDSGFDAEGNCIGQIYLFSGENKQCRLRSIKNPLVNCCQSNSAWKPRFRCNDAGQMYDDAEKCGEICSKPCDLLKKQPPNLEMNILGIKLDLCKSEEKELAFRRSMFPSGGNCAYIGNRCTKRWNLGFKKICVQRKETYCCYQTPLAKIVVEAAHKQLGISWGSAGSPNCRGITPEEFSQVNLDQVDFSAWIESYVIPAIGNQAADMLERMQLP